MPTRLPRSGSGEPATVVHVVPGPDGHGVTRHALSLLTRGSLAHHDILRVSDLRATSGDAPEGPEGRAEVVAQRLAAPAAALLHLHVTDHLYAGSAGECALVVEALAQGRRVGLTLHDLPSPGDGPGRYERRRAAYAAMARAAAVVIVASHHEERLLREALQAEGLEPGGEVHVVPLPLEPPTLPPSSTLPEPRHGHQRDIVVFGFLYPGKGHVPAIDALVGPPPLPADTGVTALGAVSPGHEYLVGELTARAAALGRRFTVTGHVPDDELVARLRSAALPAAPHEHVSASGSIGSWFTAGRRPLAPVGDYVDELESRCPGAVLRYGPGTPFANLTEAARAALDDAALTWLGPEVDLHPTPDEAAAEYARILDAVAVR